jgi:hypothetical protein
MPTHTAYSYRTATLLVNGDTSLASAFAVWPLAVKAARFQFPSPCYLAGLWLSTSMANPTPVKIGVWIASQLGLMDVATGTEFISLAGAQNVWLTHISRNVVTTSKSSGIGWEIPNMPLFAAGETLTIWCTNGNDAGVKIDVTLTLFMIDPPLPEVNLAAPTALPGIASVWKGS